MFCSFKVSPYPEPAGMETGQPTGDSAEGGSTSIAEELLRAIMENPQSTPDKVAIHPIDFLWQEIFGFKFSTLPFVRPGIIFCWITRTYFFW